MVMKQILFYFFFFKLLIFLLKHLLNLKDSKIKQVLEQISTIGKYKRLKIKNNFSTMSCFRITIITSNFVVQHVRLRSSAVPLNGSERMDLI